MRNKQNITVSENKVPQGRNFINRRSRPAGEIKGLSRRRCEFLFPTNKQNKPTKTSDRRSITLARRSVPLRRAEIFDGPVVWALRATPNQINRSFPSGVSQKPHSVVIARRNDEAIQLFSDTSGLLHFVRNDESGLLRQPRTRIGNHPVVIGRRNGETIHVFSDTSGLLHFVTNDDCRIMSPVGDGMSVENNFHGFTACRRYATCREKYTFRTCGTKRTTMRLFLPTYCACGTTFPPVETDFNRRLSTADPMLSSVSFVCSPEIKTRNDESGLFRHPRRLNIRKYLAYQKRRREIKYSLNE